MSEDPLYHITKYSVVIAVTLVHHLIVDATMLMKKVIDGSIETE